MAARARERYLSKLGEQARGGDDGTDAELNAAIIRDLVAAGRGDAVPLSYVHDVVAGIRKLRRQLEGLGKGAA